MPGGSICSSLSNISVRDGGLGRGEASARSIKLSGSQQSCTGRLSAAPRASSSQHPISLPARLISLTPRLKFPVAQSLLPPSSVGPGGHVENTGRWRGSRSRVSDANAARWVRSAEMGQSQRERCVRGRVKQTNKKRKKKTKTS